MRLTIALLIGIAALPAQAQEAQDRGSGQHVVVTGIRLPEYRERLRQCLARNCPVNEDVDATLALAEAEMIQGEYRDARMTIAASLRRNRDEAARYPEPVSDLHRSYARVSRHLGEDADALRSAHNILDALREGLPREDHRHFTARFEIADMQLRSGRWNSAYRELADLARAGRAAGREDVAITAELRRHWYSYMLDPHGPGRSRLTDFASDADPADRQRARAARVLLARIHRIEGDSVRADALLGEVARTGTATGVRRLLHVPRFQLAGNDMTPVLDADAPTMAQFGNVRNRYPGNLEGKWIDVGYWIDADGRVSDIEIVRRGGDASWAGPLLESIRGRLYSAGAEPAYRLERYTLTSGYETAQTGTRIRQHGPNLRVEYMDLSESDGTAAAPAPGSDGGGAPAA